MRLKMRLSHLLEMETLNWSDASVRKYGVDRDNIPKIIAALKRGRWSISFTE